MDDNRAEGGCKFTWFPKFTDVFNSLGSDAEKCELAMALINYGTYRTEPKLENPICKTLFLAMHDDIDNSVNARHNNKGGRPKKGQSKNGGFDIAETGVSEYGNPNHFNTNHTNTNHANTVQGTGSEYQSNASHGEQADARATRTRFCPDCGERLRSKTDCLMEGLANKGEPGKLYCPECGQLYDDTKGEIQ